MAGKTAGGKSVCLVGSPGSGKSTFLAGLELLGGPDSASKYALNVARNGAPMAEAAKTLKRGEWLAKTGDGDGYEVEGQLSRGGREVVRLKTRDYDGRRALLPGEDDQVGPMIEAADVILLALSADHAADEAERVLTRPGGGVISRDDEATTVLKALRVRRDADGSGRHRRPVVAVVLTKADANPALVDRESARKFLESTAPAAYRKLLELSPGLAVFPVSAVGGVEVRPDGSTSPKQPPAPRGYDELFDWTFDQLKQRRRSWLRYVVVTTVVAVVGVTTALLLGGKAVIDDQIAAGKAVVNDPNRSIVDRAKTAAESGSCEVAAEGVAVVKARLAGINETLGGSPSEAELHGIVSELAALGQSGLTAVAAELADVKRAAEQMLRATALARLKAQDRTGPRRNILQDELRAFAQNFGGTAEAKEANAILAAMAEAQRQEARRAIIDQHVPGRIELERKVRLINDYMAMYRESEPRKGEIDRAARVATGLLERKTYKLTLVGSGTFAEKRSHVVRLEAPGQPFSFESAGPRVKAEQWDRAFELAWTAGDSFVVELWLYHGSYPFGDHKRAATVHVEGPVAILRLVQPVALNGEGGWGFEGDPTVTLRVESLDADDARCVGQFLTTSDGW